MENYQSKKVHWNVTSEEREADLIQQFKAHRRRMCNIAKEILDIRLARIGESDE